MQASTNFSRCSVTSSTNMWSNYAAIDKQRVGMWSSLTSVSASYTETPFASATVVSCTELYAGTIHGTVMP